MKLRMAENSLFAVLLRSRWWISFAVAAGVVAVAQALLPPEYRLVGSLACVPFVVIGGIAFVRQIRAPSPAKVQALLEGASAMAWPQFEAALRAGFMREGHTVQAVGHGADLLLERGGRRVLVSARRWKAARHGEDAVQALQAAMARQDVGQGAYVALNDLTPQARALAARSGIELLQGEKLARLLG